MLARSPPPGVRAAGWPWTEMLPSPRCDCPRSTTARDGCDRYPGDNATRSTPGCALCGHLSAPAGRDLEDPPLDSPSVSAPRASAPSVSAPRASAPAVSALEESATSEAPEES